MAFDANWEDIHAAKEWGKYPNEEVIRFTARNFPDRKKRAGIRILDLGCGGGATSWYLAREGFDVYGVDGSPSAIRRASAYLEGDQLTATFSVGDIVNLDFESNSFDAVYDVDVIECNKAADIRTIYKEILRVLKPGGRFFSVAINDASGKEEATEVEKNTFRGLKILNHGIRAHFFTKAELGELTAPFDNVVIDSIVRTLNNGTSSIGHYLISATKKG